MGMWVERYNNTNDNSKVLQNQFARNRIEFCTNVSKKRGDKKEMR